MSTADNRELAKRFVDSLGDLTGESLAPLLTETSTFELMVRSRGIPLAAKMTGSEFLELMHAMTSVLPKGIRHVPRGEPIAEGDYVSIETDCRADLPGGRIYNNAFVFILRMHDGRIDEVREYCDLLHAKEELFPEPVATAAAVVS
jgi:ketosteroid isomerase-like protein